MSGIKMRKIASSAMNFIFQGTKVAAVTFLAFNYLGGFVVCYGPSMEPTLYTRDILLTEHISPRLKRIDIGDVVVARSPSDYRFVCKRVVAGPGDIVLYKNKTLTIPEEYVWLEGDNKENSNDSRFYGPVPFSMVRRRCFCKLWPNLDLELGSAEKNYLESSPSEQQIEKHQRAMEHPKTKQKWSKEPPGNRGDDGGPTGNNDNKPSATTSNTSGLFTIFNNKRNENDNEEELFPMMLSKDNNSSLEFAISTDDSSGRILENDITPAAFSLTDYYRNENNGENEAKKEDVTNHEFQHEGIKIQI